MSEFPCVVCSKECKSSAIRCSNCKNWVHPNCLCKCCSFFGEDYNCRAALGRSQAALESRNTNTDISIGITSDEAYPQCLNAKSVDVNVTKISIEDIPKLGVHIHVSDLCGASSDTESQGTESVSNEETKLQGPLDSRFMDTCTVVKLLKSCNTGLENTPSGLKENVFFIVKNDMNLLKRAKNQHSSFSDDCGVWDSACGSTPKSTFIAGINGGLTSIFCKNGLYCFKRLVQRKFVFVPMDPQPDSAQIVVVHRYYTKLKLDRSYKKRITWLGDCSPYVVVEYIGKFPGLSAHGNSQTQYIPTPDYEMTDVHDLLAKAKPTVIHDTLSKKYDKIDALNITKRHNNDAPDITTIHNNDAPDITKRHNNDAPGITKRHNNDAPGITKRHNNDAPGITKRHNYDAPDITKRHNNDALDITKRHNKTKYMHAKNRLLTGLQTGPLNNIADHIQRLENMITYNHRFVRSSLRASGRTPCIILYADQQIADLKTLCATGHTVLAIDKTFELCDMHVTVTSYKQMTVTRPRTNKAPIFIGPLFIHDDNDFEAYGHFFYHLKMKLVDTNLDRLVIESNEKPALVKAITTVFPDSTHVPCPRHLRQNHVLKQLDWEYQPLVDLVDSLDSLVHAQFKGLRGALVSTGEFRLAPTHEQFQVTKTQWISMTSDQRDSLYTRYRNFPIPTPGFQTSTDGQSAIPSPKTYAKKPSQQKRKLTDVIMTQTKKTKLDD